ncbi:hypothetical protein [Nitrosomonas aestuarii]|uniref:hypothetical protein n=1 Tax=Nitrosomonas aestuarii TaxID=52441 RepID=UPI00147986D8|nr:hypothetical protein [Nitrosomonas aestuarii]
MKNAPPTENPGFKGNAQVVEFDDLGDATRGLFSINNPWPGGVVDSFAAHM